MTGVSDIMHLACTIRKWTRKELITVALAANSESFRAMVKGRQVALFARGAAHSEFFNLPSILRWHWALAAEWGRCAFPVITMSRTYGEGLVSTSPHGIDVRAPWRAFLVQTDAIPGVQSVLVYFDDGRWTIIAHCGEFQLHTFHSSTEQFVRGESADGGEDVERLWWNHPLDTKDERILQLIGLLVVNSCIAMTDPTNARHVGGGLPGHKYRSSNHQKQRCQIYEIGRPVAVNCRQSIADYIAGRTSAVRKVQWLRRGHWRHQACGPRLSERRLQWIEPTWMNRKSGGPILVRPHVLSESMTHAERVAEQRGER